MKPGSTLARVLGAVALIVVALPSPASAALVRTVVADGGNGLVVETVDTNSFPNVTLTVGVSGGLEAIQASGEQFRVTENGVERPVTVEPADNPDDLNVVIVFDRSGSMGNDPLRAAKDAALAFVAALPAEINIGLVSFSSDETVDVPLTKDRAVLNAAIEKLDSDGRTSLYDGVILASTLFDASMERKILVVLSDGGDNESSATLEDAVAAVSGMTVEMIELATKESNRAALDQLAAPLTVRSTQDPKQLEDLYRSVAQSLVGRVNLRFESAVPKGSVMQLTVTLGEGATARSVSFDVATPAPPETTTTVATTLPPLQVAEPALESNDSTMARVVSFVLICGGFMCAFYFASDRRIRLSRERLIPSGTEARGKKRTFDPLRGLKARIESSEKQRQLIADIATLGLERSPGSIIVLTLGIALFGALLGLLIQGLLAGLILAFVVLVIARMRLNSKLDGRKSEFIDQLPETLSTLASMLRTGYGLTQALKAVADEAEEPTKSWLSKVLLEVSTGRDLIEAMRSLAVQINSVDFDWVIAGIEISRETGGDLAKTMDTVAETIRERDRLRNRVRSLTAEGRFSAYIMLALPPGVGILTYLINPDFYSVFLEPIGLFMIGLVIVLMTAGYFWMRGMIRKVAI